MSISEIFIVDDDCDARDALAVAFGRAGYLATTFADGESFIRHARDRRPACVLLDLCMPGPSGLEVLKQLDASTYGAPILILSGQRDVPNVVLAMKSGAFDYIEKRLDADAIVGRVAQAIDMWRQQNDASSPGFSSALSSYDQLTPREREVLAQIAAAASNKEIAKKLGISPRTVEIHRGHIMQKIGAKNSVDLMRIVMSKARGV